MPQRWEDASASGLNEVIHCSFAAARGWRAVAILPFRQLKSTKLAQSECGTSWHRRVSL